MQLTSHGGVAPERLADPRERDARGHGRHTGNGNGRTNRAGAPEGTVSS